MINIDETKLSRFEVIDWRKGGEGRALVAECTISLSVQDDNRTLKVFLQDKEELA